MKRRSDTARRGCWIRRADVLVLLLIAILPLPGGTASGQPSTRLIVEDVEEPVFGGTARIYRSNPQGRQAVVLLPGLNGEADRDWRGQFDVLARKFHVISFDLPGFGASASQGKIYSPEKYAQFLDFVAQRYTTRPFHLVGHSLGGAVALLYAGTRSRNVDRLVLVDSAGVLHALAYAKFLSSSTLRSSGTASPGAVRYLEDLTGKLLEELERVQPTLNDLILGHVYGTAAQAETAEPTAIAALTQTDFSTVLPAVTAPTLVIWGEQDQITPLRTAHVLARRIPQAELQIFSGAGHMPMVEDTERFNTLLIRHLDKGATTRERTATPRGGNAARVAESVRDGSCRSTTGMVFTGSYRSIDIRNCADVTLRGVSARQVTIFESRVDIVDSDISSDGVAMDLVGSDVRITASDIDGQTAVQAARSRLDVAGGKLTGRASGLASRGGVKAIFSVSDVDSGSGRRYVHGYVALAEGGRL